ncbi:MAG: hypothetical protein VKJ06_05240 [Vampirovibrionales bacterium]|nr:hypothetical protein [Vampirovibrionales bacterium]
MALIEWLSQRIHFVIDVVFKGVFNLSLRSRHLKQFKIIIFLVGAIRHFGITVEPF